MSVLLLLVCELILCPTGWFCIDAIAFARVTSNNFWFMASIARAGGVRRDGCVPSHQKAGCVIAQRRKLAATRGSASFGAVRQDLSVDGPRRGRASGSGQVCPKAGEVVGILALCCALQEACIDNSIVGKNFMFLRRNIPLPRLRSNSDSSSGFGVDNAIVGA